MWLRISKEFDIDYIPEPLVVYNVHENRISTNYDSMIRGMETINQKYEHFFSLDRNHFSDRYYRLGVFYCYTGEIGKGRGALLKAIRLYPFDARYYFRLCLSLLGAKNFKKAHDLRERLTA